MPDPITLSIEPLTVECRAGSAAQVRIRVTNLSQETVHYRLSADIYATWARFEPDQLSAFPGESVKALLDLHPPANAEVATFPINVVVQVIGGKPGQASAAVKLIVLPSASPIRPGQHTTLSSPSATRPQASTTPGEVPMPNATANPPSDTASSPEIVRAASPGAGLLQITADRSGVKLVPGGQKAFHLTIYNGGGSQLAVLLMTHGVPKEWLKLPPSPVDLAPRQTFSGVLQVSPPTIAPPGAYPLHVTAQDRERTELAASLELTIELLEEAESVPAVTPMISGTAPTTTVPRVTVPSPFIAPEIPEGEEARAVITQTAAPKRAETKARPRIAPLGVGIGIAIAALILCIAAAAIAIWISPNSGFRPNEQSTFRTAAPAFGMDFRSDRSAIQPGGCANLQWEVYGALEARLDNQPVPLQGARQVCPQVTTHYSLVANTGQSSVPRELVIEVSSSQVTSVPPTMVPPPPPTFGPVNPPTAGPPPPPTAGPMPPPTMGPIAPPPVGPPTAVIPPGFYVNNIRLDPSAPKKGQDITFIASFVNTTGSEMILKACAEIFLAEEMRNSHGITPCQNRTIPVGASQVSLDTWAARGIANCIAYRARAIFISDSNRIPIKRTDGSDYWLTYEVCP